MQRWKVDQLKQDGKSYSEFLRQAEMSMGVYRLAPGATDGQTPHAEDEVYFVISGRARFQGGDQDMPVQPGDLLYVPASVPHRFHSITEALELLVFFAPAEGSRQ